VGIKTPINRAPFLRISAHKSKNPLNPSIHRAQDFAAAQAKLMKGEARGGCEEPDRCVGQAGGVPESLPDAICVTPFKN
jgi:hypothetical protein